MKKLVIILVGLFVLFTVSCALAIDVTLEWDASDGATGYKIYKSEDLRVTWDAGIDVGNVLTYVYIDVREDGPVDFRVSAYNLSTEAVRYWSGAWYDHTLRPPNSPGGTGIE